MLVFLGEASLTEIKSPLSPRKKDVQQTSLKPTVNKRVGE